MDFLDAVLLALALGADSFSVSIGIGMSDVSMLRTLKLASLFGGVQGLLLAAGVWLAGWLHQALDQMSHGNGWLARWMCELNTDCVHSIIHSVLSLTGAGILCIVGANLICNYFMRPEEKPVYYKGRFALLLLTLSVSADALSAGIGLGMIEGSSLLQVSSEVAVIVALMAMVGLRSGKRIGRLIGRRAEPVGGILLILLALHLVLQVV